MSRPGDIPTINSGAPPERQFSSGPPDDPQARAIGMYESVPHPALGEIETLAAPFVMHGSDVRVRGRAPELGEHTDDVLADLGVGADELAALREAGVIA